MNELSPITAAVLEKTVAQGDLTLLTAEQRLRYYLNVCNSIGLNPHTKPLEYIRLSGKLVLYAKRDATDQLRKLHGVSLHVVSRDESDGILTVAVRATTRDGRTDEDIGAVPTAGLKGEARCNATMKAMTKAKRRVTLSICGLGMLDESELEGIPATALVRSEEPATEARLPAIESNASAADWLGDSIPALDELPEQTLSAEAAPTGNLRDAINVAIPLRQPKPTVAQWLDAFAAKLEACSNRAEVEAAILCEEVCRAAKTLTGREREKLQELIDAALARHTETTGSI
jgi:hypothetical protein